MRRHGFIGNRVFDVLACGGFALSDHLPELAEKRWRGCDLRQPRELAGKLGRYLRNPAERQERADRGRAAVLGGHTVDHRAAELEAVIEDAFRHRRVSPPGGGSLKWW